MIKEITFVTGNERKFKNALIFFKDSGISLIQEEMKTPEIQAGEIVEVAEYSAKYAGEKLNKAVIKVDVGFFIEELNGFPGPYIKFINKWLDPEKVLDLCANLENRKAYFEDVVSCYIPNMPIKSFSAKTWGTLSTEVLGENGWGIDKIFIPNGFDTTLANMSDEIRSTVWSSDRWLQLVSYLKSFNI
jgi:XTP/dITP diphosphohydrolase